MTSCSVCENLQIVPGCLDDYKRLARYHYLGSHIGPASAIFILSRAGGKTPVGVIVYHRLFERAGSAGAAKYRDQSRLCRTRQEYSIVAD